MSEETGAEFLWNECRKKDAELARLTAELEVVKKQAQDAMRCPACRVIEGHLHIEGCWVKDLEHNLEAAKFNVVNLNSMNADYAKRERESLASAEAAEARLSDLERALEKIAEEGGPDFDADDMASCARAALTPAPQIAGEAKPSQEK